MRGQVDTVPAFPLTSWLIGECAKFFLNNCAHSSKKTFMCPKFCTNPVLKYTKRHVSTNLSNFLKLRLLQGVHKVRVHFKKIITLIVFAIEIICEKDLKEENRYFLRFY